MSHDYQSMTPLGGDCAGVRFRGTFQGREVTWDATLMTLAHYRARTASAEQTDIPLQQFIDIEPGNADGDIVPVTVALDVQRIDEPTVLKAIIMLRQYKRLRPGRHCFGPSRRFG